MIFFHRARLICNNFWLSPFDSIHAGSHRPVLFFASLLGTIANAIIEVHKIAVDIPPLAASSPFLPIDDTSFLQ